MFRKYLQDVDYAAPRAGYSLTCPVILSLFKMSVKGDFCGYFAKFSEAVDFVFVKSVPQIVCAGRRKDSRKTAASKLRDCNKRFSFWRENVMIEKMCCSPSEAEGTQGFRNKRKDWEVL